MKVQTRVHFYVVKPGLTKNVFKIGMNVTLNVFSSQLFCASITQAIYGFCG